MVKDTDGKEETVHDQLPTVQEIHNRVSMDERVSSSTSKRSIKVIAVVAILVIISIIVFNRIFVKKRSASLSNDPESGGTTQAKNIFEEISSIADLETFGSPQQRAYDWMINVDTYMKKRAKKIPESLTDDGGVELKTRYILAVLYFALNGENWKEDFNFLTSSVDACLWHAEYFDFIEDDTFYRGASCNPTTYEIVSISMPNNDMQGTLPTEIGLLSELKELALSSNNISGSLPPQLSKLSSLRFMLLGNNQLTGTLPAWFGELSDVRSLSISSNSLHGSIPNDMASMSRLTLLGLSDNDFSGTLPQNFENFLSLNYLFLSNNKFEGTIPSWIGNNLNLKDLRLSNNRFTGVIPKSFRQLNNIQNLYVDSNKLEGDLNPIQSMTSLEILLLENNLFEADLDNSFLSNIPKLRILDASNNQLGGTFPSLLFQKSSLELIDLHSNLISNPLPKSFPKSSKLKYLSLYNNVMTSSIPESISNLKELTHLDLSANQFTGNIPSSLGSMTPLTYLFLAINDFDSAEIPVFSGLINLEELSLKGTSRVGEIPRWIGGLTNLILLDLDSNQLTGSLPESIGDLEELIFLLLNRNELEGTVPASIQQLQKLRVLLIDDNNFSALGKGYFDFCDNLSYLGKAGSVFTADCGGDDKKINCECCTECCGGSTLCNDGSELLANQDLTWQQSYKRSSFNFSDEVIYFM